MSAERARLVIVKHCHGVLLPDVVLPFDDAELAGNTVADVLAIPRATRAHAAPLGDGV